MIRVVIVDDDALVRMGLADLLEADDDIDVVGQAADGAEGIEAVRAHRPDVVLMDVRMPRLDGIAAIEAVRALPDPPKIITLTTFDLDDYVYRAVAAGADGFLLKDTAPADIVKAVHLVADGSAMLHPAAARRLIDKYHRSGSDRASHARSRIEKLTPRENDVLRLLAQGDTNAEIAETLGMREGTVKAHVSRILMSLGASNRVQAALIVRDAEG